MLDGEAISVLVGLKRDRARPREDIVGSIRFCKARARQHVHAMARGGGERGWALARRARPGGCATTAAPCRTQCPRATRSIQSPENKCGGSRNPSTSWNISACHQSPGRVLPDDTCRGDRTIQKRGLRSTFRPNGKPRGGETPGWLVFGTVAIAAMTLASASPGMRIAVRHVRTLRARPYMCAGRNGVARGFRGKS